MHTRRTIRRLGLSLATVALLGVGCGGSSGGSGDDSPDGGFLGPGNSTESGSPAGLTESGTGFMGIETIGMDSRYTMGAGGAFYFLPSPVIIFQDGSLCEDIDFLTEGLDKEAHQAKYPDSWTVWRWTDGTRQIQNSKGEWDDLAYSSEYPPLAAGTTLAAGFTNTSGGGDTAVGGSTIIGVVSQISFSADGRFSEGSSVGASSSGTTVSSNPPDEQGQYAIEGYFLKLTYDDGTEKVHSLVIDINEPTIMWLDGSPYLNNAND